VSRIRWIIGSISLSASLSALGFSALAAPVSAEVAAAPDSRTSTGSDRADPPLDITGNDFDGLKQVTVEND
jgi:hypothetical protein